MLNNEFIFDPWLYGSLYHNSWTPDKKTLKKSELKNDWYLIDGNNAVVGRLASIIAKIFCAAPTLPYGFLTFSSVDLNLEDRANKMAF